tara:strand:+ start:879 stop:1307 length:429 start_codon:yes stop_codon:yes gene_type:complete
LIEKNQLIESITGEVDNLGYTIWDISIKGNGPNLKFTVFLDGSVSIKDCVDVSRSLMNSSIRNILEKGLLEVSSPGVEPVLRKTKHFQRWFGKEIVFKMKNGSKAFFGVLRDFKNCLVVEMKNGIFYVPFELVKNVTGVNRS